MDFFQIRSKEGKGGVVDIYPNFTVGRSKDLMIRGGKFYAIWNEEMGLWSTDEYDVQRLVDQELEAHAKELDLTNVKYLRSYDNNGWNQFRNFMRNLSDNSHQLDETLVFANTEVRKNDYVSRRLPYPLQEGDYSAWDELVGVLYSPEERAKIEWAIGAVLSGDSKKLQKFVVLYGAAGTGKSTILNVIARLFEGYTASFEAKALVGANNAFGTEIFRGNPLVAIQHDGDLSKIEDNSKLNSIISHEEMTMNEKYKPSYTARINAFLFMGTNKPVKISDAKSGIIRRLIDVHPTGQLFQPNHYNTLMARIEFELGAIAFHCLEVYREMGKNYYNTYRPLDMMFQTDVFFNFVEAHFDIFKTQEYVTLKQAYALYKEYCNETGLDFVMPQYRFRDELKNYFREFTERTTRGGVPVRSVYSVLLTEHFKSPVASDTGSVFRLVLDEDLSLLDLELAEMAAQYAKEDGTPRLRWSQVTDTLANIDTREVHYVKVPENHIVIDFDLVDDSGDKSLERNLEAASLWPATYAELSRSGSAVHLHYTYEGDVSDLAIRYDAGIEVKTLLGDASLRRRLSKCNNVPVATISSGLPLKEKKVINTDVIKTEKGLRELIGRNLRKEIHPGTKPSIDFIAHILDEAYLSGLTYDLTDLRAVLLAFANNSTNQPLQCLKVVQKMRFKSEDAIVRDEAPWEAGEPKDKRLVFFDIEVYPNLFVVCWKFEGEPDVVRMINPTPQEIESLFQFRLVGFNNRRYDNHMFWARYMGYDNEQLYKLSVKIIDGNTSALFGEAFNLSWADVYDYSTVKQSLKKFQIQLGIHHMELDLPWHEPVKDEDIPRVVEYCVNDVVSLEAVHESRAGDYKARQILAELAGMSVNDTTQKLTARIIFGSDRNPQRGFKYTDLSKEFPGYAYDRGRSSYRGEDPSEGGYVYAEPGMYQNVAVLDVASMHPTSIKNLNLFGEYTPNFVALLDARLAIKRKDISSAKKMLGGKLAKYLSDEENLKPLSDALKIAINIVYGLTSAKFDNMFRDNRNKDNIVAKRGALFMIDLKNAVQEMGFSVVHIKTDSIKIPDATPEIIEFVTLFGEKYGYTFEHETTYSQFCLVNDAVYIAREDKDGVPNWNAVGAQFQHPYVFKSLFTREPIEFRDLCEAKAVTQGAMYLDFSAVHDAMFNYSGMHFVGRTGLFVPVIAEAGGGILLRVKDEKSYAVTGTKGYFWVEAEHAVGLAKDVIDMSYFERLVEEARNAIDYYGPFATFIA